MNDLALILDDVRFAELVERGRAVIPTAAPDWTDHNAHDPGIMLVELVAWIAEAQIYGLSRLRRDERLAYAALLGVRPRGRLPAQGYLWPPDTEPDRASWRDDAVVEPSQRLASDAPDAPAFFSTHPIRLWSARLGAVQTHRAAGGVVDWTRVNREDGATFRPFGGAPRSGDRLVLQLDGRPHGALAQSKGLIAIGFDVVRPASAAAPSDLEASPPIPRLRVSIVDRSRGERTVRIEADTTGGLLRSGVLLLELDERSRPVDRDFEIVLQSTTGGFLVPPRLQRVTLNVLPVRQLEQMQDDEPAFGTGLPDQTHRLAQPPVVDPDDDSSFSVTTLEDGKWLQWTLLTDLQSPSQHERIVALDATGVLRFGNGVNGVCVPPRATLRVRYRTCTGVRGNLPPGSRWTVPGAGVVYANGGAMSGGSDEPGLDALRIEARHRMRQRRPCVSRVDLEERALSFTDLGVTRAYEWAPDAPSHSAMRGARTLVVTGPHDPEGDDTDVTESEEWLNEIRRRLAACMPLGQSLTVVAPRYVEVRVVGTLVGEPGVDPTVVAADVVATIRDRLAIVPHAATDDVWPFGRAVSLVTVKGWLRAVEGVTRVQSLQLWRNGRAVEKDVALGALGLPRLRIEPGDITVERAARGGSR